MTDQRRLLEPFPSKAVKTVDKGKYSASYVSWTDKLQRLFAYSVPFDWAVLREGGPVGFQTVEQEYTDRRTGEITTRNVSKPVGGSGDPHEPFFVVGRLRVFIDEAWRESDGMGQGQDMKKAETDAFSRACAKVGLGLHLWCAGGDKDSGFWVTKALDGELG